MKRAFRAPACFQGYLCSPVIICLSTATSALALPHALPNMRSGASVVPHPSVLQQNSVLFCHVTQAPSREEHAVSVG